MDKGHMKKTGGLVFTLSGFNPSRNFQLETFSAVRGVILILTILPFHQTNLFNEGNGESLDHRPLL